MSVPSVTASLNKILEGTSNASDVKTVMHVAKVALGTLAVLGAMIAMSKMAALAIGLGALAYLSSEVETIANQQGFSWDAFRNNVTGALLGDPIYAQLSNTPALRAYYLIAKDIHRALN